MGLATNSRWMHSVHTDKMPENAKDPAERSPRNSLTFHHIDTFLTTPPQSPAGQGQGQTKTTAHILTGRDGQDTRGGEGAERLLAEFGAENHESEFDWEMTYGQGFDVLDFAARTPALV